HRAGAEPPYDALHRLDRFDRDQLRTVEAELHQSSKSAEAAALVVYPLRVGLEDFVAARARGVLEPEDRLRVEEMVFPIAPPLDLPARRQLRRSGGPVRVAAAMHRQHLARDLRQSDAAHPGGSLG